MTVAKKTGEVVVMSPRVLGRFRIMTSPGKKEEPRTMFYAVEDLDHPEAQPLAFEVPVPTSVNKNPSTEEEGKAALVALTEIQRTVGQMVLNMAAANEGVPPVWLSPEDVREAYRG